MMKAPAARRKGTQRKPRFRANPRALYRLQLNKCLELLIGQRGTRKRHVDEARRNRIDGVIPRGSNSTASERVIPFTAALFAV